MRPYQSILAKKMAVFGSFFFVFRGKAASWVKLSPTAPLQI